MRSIAILGATGSIGRQTLDEVSRHPDRFRVAALSAHTNREALFEAVRAFRSPAACLTGADLGEIPKDLSFCQFYARDELEKMVRECEADDVLDAIVGIAGLGAAWAARQAGKRLLLAIKETLVTGGRLIMDACGPNEDGPTLLPVDSEHSAIFQCLQAAGPNKVKTIFLTASGGPFRTWSRERIQKATLEEALRHPTWSMGAKITVDSASMFNKALEIIEARWLFDVTPEQIQAVVHPQSIVHSMIGFEDGAVLAQLGVPDMRVPILYAMTYPERLESGVPAPDFAALSSLTFEPGDPERFPALRLAYETLNAGGASCCVLNGANEVAVAAFLKGLIPFGSIYACVEETLNRLGVLPAEEIADIYEADRLARRAARDYLKL
ncbi:MAG: 1-deoxy-D-xylulose-5-phosphate reductoisomerase [Clostridia bacterium]|nr:1-deoxy-D-xylulose-5-phosphate reductoisomerase [Clostridia bacterium]